MEDDKNKLSDFSTIHLKEELYKRRTVQDSISNDKIKEIICNYYGANVECLKSKKAGARKNPCRLSKRALAYIFRNEYKKGYMEIGEIMHKNHVTILMAVRAVTNEMEVNKHYKKELEHLINLTK